MDGAWGWHQFICILLFIPVPFFTFLSLPYLSRNEEGEEHLRQRKLQLPFSFATGEAVLYETTPSPDITNISTQIKGGKISKPASLPPSSLLSSMLKQDESVYQANSNPNSQFCLEKAFRDSHALLNIPGKSWSGAERNTVGIKEESTAQEMMDSLQQIFGDMTGTMEELNLDQEELKEWENALFRMNSLNSSEIPVEVNDILANDIFTYVEDVLFKECNTNTNDQLPQCLSELQLQGDLNDLLGISESLEMGSPAREMMKLAHPGPEMPLGQQVEPFVELCESMIFDSSHSGQQNQARLVQQTATSQQNQAGLRLQAQNHIQSGSLGYPENVTLPNLQNQAQHVGFHNRRSAPLNQTIQPSTQWAGPQAPSSDKVLFNPAPSAYIKGQFPLRSQSVDNQRLEPWQQPQPSVQQGHPTLPSVPNIAKVPNIQNIPNGHHCVQPVPLTNLMPQAVNFDLGSHPQPNVISNAVYGQQGGHVHPPNAVFGQPGERLQMPNAAYGQQGELLHQAKAVFGQQGEMMETSSAAYNPQGELLNSVTPAPVSSCMFERAVQAPVNGLRYGSAGQDVVILSCQKTKEFLAQNPLQGTYVFQNGPAENMLNNVGVTAGNCHLQQQFLTCNGQTQVTCKLCNLWFCHPDFTGHVTYLILFVSHRSQPAQSRRTARSSSPLCRGGRRASPPTPRVTLSRTWNSCPAQLSFVNGERKEGRPHKDTVHASSYSDSPLCSVAAEIHKRD